MEKDGILVALRASSPLWRLKQCPVTGLPIVSRPEWQGIALTAGYSVSFCVIGDAGKGRHA